jgi:hypothetical protein
MSDEPTNTRVVTPKWHEYGVGFTVTTELAQNNHARDRLLDNMCADMLQAAAENRQLLADQLFSSPIVAVPPTRMDRFRAWLGYRVWKLAVWIDPDLLDY